MDTQVLLRQRRARIVLGIVAVCLLSSVHAQADLVGYWPLDGDANDASGMGNDGIVEGDAEFVNDVPAQLGGGMSIDLFAGLDPGYVDLGNPDILNFADNDWTITAWMKTPDGLSERGNIYSNGGDNSGGVRYVLAFLENGGQAIVLTTDDNSTKVQAQASDVDWLVNDEEWHHVVGLRDDTELRVYIDGEFAADNFVPAGYDLSETSQQPAYIGIGADAASGDFEKSFQGWVDDVAVFDQALTEEQIMNVMNSDFSEWIAVGGAVLQAGDADMDCDFDQLDLVQVQVAAKYLTGEPATWGEGDWDGAPGGSANDKVPPPGNGQFDQLDIIAALSAGKYLQGSYCADAGMAAVAPVRTPPDGVGDEQTSIVYNATTGEVSVEAPASTELTSVNIDSASGIFVGHENAQNLDGSFDTHSEENIFKATFGESFGDTSFGLIAQAGLSADFVAEDLTVIGSLDGGGGLGDVDLIYVPEPSSVMLFALGLALILVRRRRVASIG